MKTQLAAAVRTRPAGPEDYPVFSRLFPELGVDDALPERERFVSEIMPNALIAEIEGEAVGYSSGRALAETGYVIHVIVDPSHRQRGVARTLMQDMADHYRNQGLTRWGLNVKPDNQPALALYRGLGMETQYESHVIRFPWTLVDQWPEASNTLSLVVPAPADDDAIESALSMNSGRLASRRKSSYVLLGIQEDKRWVGFAAFSPAHPGAFPFKVRSPELAAPLLRALRAHATKAEMQIVAEDAPDLADHLIAAGASLYLRLLHLEGPL